MDDAVAWLGERADRGHLGVVELEIEDRDILREPLGLRGARNHDGAFLDEKPQATWPADLACRVPIRASPCRRRRPRAIGL